MTAFQNLGEGQTFPELVRGPSRSGTVGAVCGRINPGLLHCGQQPPGDGGGGDCLVGSGGGDEEGGGQLSLCL